MNASGSPFRTATVIFFALWVALAPMAPVLAGDANPNDFRNDVARFKQLLSQALEQYRAGDRIEARLSMGKSFVAFEQSGTFHDRLKSRNLSLYKELEGAWIGVAPLMKNEASASTVAGKMERVQLLLDRALLVVQNETSAAGLFWGSFLIIFREGFEAILVIGALAAYLRKANREDGLPYLYGGTGLALFASILLYVGARTLFSFDFVAQETLEGVTMLLACVVLFTVSYWLISKAQASQWQAYIKEKAESAISSGRLVAFGSLAFFVVFREGFETVLFYQALLVDAGTVQSGLTAVGGGFAVGGTLIGLVYLAMSRWGMRIRMGLFFGVTGALLYVLAFKFAGDGVRELQEAGYISITSIGFSLPAFFRNFLGIHPTVETLIPQALLILAVIGGLTYTWLKSGRDPEQAVPDTSGDDSEPDEATGEPESLASSEA